eukprot:evm.model.scf_2798.3 EVM.evm.TU.scf_2798.3   scf_2798:13298-18695(+)
MASGAVGFGLGRGPLQDEGAMDMEIRIEPRRGQLATDLDIMWLLLAAYLVFFMQCGFALLEVGSVRAKNTKNILLKVRASVRNLNVVDACVGAVVWYAWGHSFAHGENGIGANPFIGGTNMFMHNSKDVSPVEEEKESRFNNADRFFAFWLFQWAFAATSATIVSGAVAERCQFRAYVVYTFVITGFVYPIVVHWVWSKEGWLSAFRVEDFSSGEDRPDVLFDKTLGMIDFAGSGVVHMTGGGAALMAATIIGPRYGRFDKDKKVQPMVGQSPALTMLGIFILWFGWYGFNPGSTLEFYEHMYVASKCAVNTTLSAAGGGLTTLLVDTVVFNHPPDISPILNGLLAGLVSITAGCASVEPYAALAIGCFSGIIYYTASLTLKKLLIDDPLDASSVHFFCGIWGVIAPGLFATPVNVENVYERRTDVGIFYGGDGSQLGVQVLGALSIGLWTCSISCVMFLTLRAFGLLRVSQDQELTGLDISRHGGAAFTYGGEDPVSVASTAPGGAMSPMNSVLPGAKRR